MNILEHDFISVVSGGKITKNSNAIEEIGVATHGLKATSINVLGKQLQWDAVVIAKAIGTTVRTLERHKQDKKPLGIKLSENALELARLSTIGISYFGDVKRWNEWLNTPNTQFDNKEPKTVVHTIRGRELIKRIIRGLEYGFTA
jgi:putative toxin-antitoxin system antitoxin component (TIGR02293 family)